MKSRFLIPFHLFVSLLVILSACTHEEGTDIQFSQLHINKEVKLINDAASPRCHIIIDMDYCTDANVKKAKAINDAIEQKLFGSAGRSARQAVQSFMNKYINDYRQQLTPLYIADRHAPGKRSWYEYQYSISTEATRAKDGYYNYLMTINSKEGDEDEVKQILSINIDARTGKVLHTAADYFVPGYEQLLHDKILQALLSKTGCKDIAALRQQGYLYGMDMYASDNFILGDNDITFIYNASEIAPADKGIIELHLSYNDLEQIMKKED